MSLGRVLAEEFQPAVLKWLRERVELIVVNPWLEPERWELEASRVDAVISRKGKIAREHMQKSAGRLKIIARTGVGVDPSRVDLDAAKEFQVWVTNQPGSNSVSVAELVFGQMIALVRHTFEANRAVKENRWGEYLKYIGTELAGKTVGIIGMGNIGTRVAIRARAFEMGFLVHDPYIPDAPVTALGGKRVELGELLAESDFLQPTNTNPSAKLQAVWLLLSCSESPTSFVRDCTNSWVDEPKGGGFCISHYYGGITMG
jgi:D-3-phosphoglycerate dehydrogenase